MSRFHIYCANTADGRISIDGRLCAGPLRLHDRFVTVASVDNVGVLTKPLNVSLEVIGITAYGHQFEELDEGLTARLCLVGNGIDALKHDLVLCTAGEDYRSRV